MAEREEGYGDILAEYDFDLAVRGDIQQALDDPALRKAPCYEDFLGAVHAADRRFRTLAAVAIPTADTTRLPWWRHRLPARGGQIFVDDARAMCGAVVEPV
ncbi:hypothetical protein [Streptomyces sp. NRRL F-5123]|uniref:hypothetical protein n=1 Tax=Streptomyces sp. NRRL F-5123 TaxID=1463856 RepID=UPI0004E0C6F7|nr:hypothetical protein [Streptomyces sp. NRRL F-5123]